MLKGCRRDAKIGHAMMPSHVGQIRDTIMEMRSEITSTREKME